MKIRKHWKKLLLSLFAILWAGCDDGSAEKPLAEYGCPTCNDDPIIDQPELYGPPCVFDGTCGDEPSDEAKTSVEGDVSK